MVSRPCKGLRHLAPVGMALCLGALLGGCSQPLLLFRGTPEPVAAAEPVTTGSIEPRSLTLGQDLNGEDWRRAQGALALALALGFGLLADLGPERDRQWGWPVVPLAVLPTLAWGVAGRLDAVAYPAD